MAMPDHKFDEAEKRMSDLRESGSIESDDLTNDDVETLEALRNSMEKGALVLRSLAELCVEKGLFTREEMKKRNQQRG